MIAYLLWRLATSLVRLIPPPIAYAGAAAIAELVFLCWPEKQRNTVDNMRHVLAGSDPTEVWRAARDSWRNYGRYLVDFIRTPSLESRHSDAKLEFENRQLLDDAFAAGKGVIFVLMHFGTWDLGGAIFARRGYPLNVVTETFGNRRLNAMVAGARTGSRIRVIPLEKSGLPIRRALRRNEALGILIDRPYPPNGVGVRFFGSDTVLPAGPARLALRTGARVLAAGVLRLPGDSNRLTVLMEPEIRVERTGNEDHDVRALTEAMLAPHERFIRQYPDQWYMFRRMWR